LIFLLNLEVNSVAVDLPFNAVFHIVLLDKHFELVLVADHELTGHVFDGDGLIGSLSRSSHLIADSIDELVDEELIGGVWNVVLRAENFVVGSLNEVLLEGHWNFDEHIIEL
jgi:hypothetical protein